MWKILRLMYLLMAIALLPAQALAFNTPATTVPPCSSISNQHNDCHSPHQTAHQGSIAHTSCCQAQPGNLPAMPQALMIPESSPLPAQHVVRFDSHIQNLPERPPQV
jgi:hypothetical protein